MTQHIWNQVKQSKGFYIETYRKACTVLTWSMMLNVFLLLAVGYVYFQQPKRNYYSSNGVTPPQILDVMYHPNDKPDALLPSDPERQPPPKKIPS